jgi:hypothetical protein
MMLTRMESKVRKMTLQRKESDGCFDKCISVPAHCFDRANCTGEGILKGVRNCNKKGGEAYNSSQLN